MTDQLSFAVEKITPAIARLYLDRNPKNRKLSTRVASRYARIMRLGQWRLNGETLKFDAGGNLIDGQHRLRGVELAGMPVEMCVIRGLAPEAFKTIDGGKARTAGDCLYVLKYAHPLALAAAGRMLYAYERGWGTIRSNTVTNDELIEIIGRHPGLVVRGHEFMKRPLYTPLIPNSVGMFAYYVTSRVAAVRARQFFEELATGKYSKPAVTHAPRVLRETLEQRSAEILKPSSSTKLAWVVQAWNCHVGREPLRRLSRIVETLPRFTPDPLKRRSA